MNFLERLLLIVKKIESVLSILILAVIAVIIGLQVFMRYFMQSPLVWPEELAALLLIYLTFFSADIVYKDKAHIAIDYFVKGLPKNFQKIVDIVVNLLILLLFALIFWVCIRSIKVQSSFNVAAALPFSKSYWTLPVPVAFASMFLSTIHYVLKDIHALLKGT